MKARARYARLSIAIAAALYGGSIARADSYIFDPQETGSTAGSDISLGSTGTWDTTTPDWVDLTTGTGGDVAWPNTATSSATFGTTTGGSVANTSSLVAFISGNITVQNLTFNAALVNSTYFAYNVEDGGSGSDYLTLTGNVYKTTAVGESAIQLTNPLTLAGGVTHVFAINDTPGAVPELSINNAIAGTDSITLNNAANGYSEWGTLVLNNDSPSFSGAVNVVDGSLTANSSLALGTGQVNVSSAGNLEFGGNGTQKVTGTLNIANAINISRSDYTDTNFNDYTDAVTSSNDGIANSVLNFNNTLTIDSVDARIAADTSTVNINKAFVIGPDVPSGSTPLADLDGDYAGLVNLNADNTAYGTAGGAIGIMGGVEVNASTIGELGGMGSKLVLSGGTLHITGALVSSDPNIVNNFGAGTSHVVNTAAVGTGVDVDTGLTFTVNGLSGGGVGMRGGGTLDFTGTNTFTGTPYYDGVDDGPGEGTEKDTTATGVVNFEAGSTTSQDGLRIRSATVNVAGTLNVGGTYTSIGADSTGSNGTPDYGTVNILNGGSVIESTGDDFNISDNANTHGTINLYAGGTLTTGSGNTYFGKSSGAVGTMNMTGGTFNSSGLVFVGQNDGTGVFNQSGGAINLTRNQNFTFVVDDGRGGTGAGSGTYNLTGGSLTSAGEVYVGEGSHAVKATWNQSAGTVALSDWFVVGRENGLGVVNISGGTFTVSNGGTIGADPGFDTSIGDSPNSSGNPDQFNVSGTGQVNINTGEMWIGNNGDGSGSAIMNIGTAAGAKTNADANASVTVNNWLAVGRGGTTTGVVNLYDGTLTQATNNFFDISGDGGSPTGIVNVYGGTLNAYQMLIGENGSGSATLNINGGNVNLPNNTIFALAGSVTGTLNLNGGTLTAYGFQANNGSIPNGTGTLNDGSAGTGAATFVFNGGTLVAYTNNTTAFIGAKVHSVVSTGGALINSNGYNVTINSALTHDTTLSGADGGLTVSGTSAGGLTLNGADTYTGPTAVTSGTLIAGSTGALPSTTAVSVGAAGKLKLAATSGAISTIKSLSITSGGQADITNNVLDINYGSGADPAGTIRSYIASGYANSAQTGSGIISSSAAGSNEMAVGYADSADGEVSGLPSDTIEVKETYLGDANMDGVVNVSDLAILAANYGNNSGSENWDQGDFTYDGDVNVSDLSVLAANFGDGTGVSEAVAQTEFQADLKIVEAEYPAFAAAVNGTSVPEPTMISLVGFGVLGLTRRRRRQS